MRSQYYLLVLIPEKHRVGKSWPDNALVTIDDGSGVVRFDIGNSDKRRHQFAFSIEHRKIPLIFLHGLDERLFRYLQKLLIKLTR